MIILVIQKHLMITSLFLSNDVILTLGQIYLRVQSHLFKLNDNLVCHLGEYFEILMSFSLND